MAEDILSNPSTSRPGSPTPSLPQTIPPPLRGNQPTFRLNWDRRRAGSVSAFSEVESKADYVGNVNAARGELQGLNDAALSVGALGSGWSSAKHGFHAISTVLNHPTKRAAPPKAHSTLPSVVPADLPRVRRKDFDPYLKDIAPQWDLFQRTVAQSTRQQQESLARSQEEIFTSSDEPMSPISPTTSLASVRTTRASAQPRPMTSLDTVPSIFFEPEFNLVDPVTFALVTEQSITSHGALEQDPAAISYSVPLLEKLSHYADTVEGHLVREIQDRSASFFSALTNLHDLQSESERCLRRIGELKSMLVQVDEKGAKKGLELVREDLKVVQLTKLEDGVKLVKDVHDMRTIAQGLANAGEWSDALNMVENMHALLDHAPQPPPTPRTADPERRQASIAEEDEDLSLVTSSQTPNGTTVSSKLPLALRDISLQNLQAFSSLPTDLRNLTTQIASTLSDEFAAVSRQDLILRADESSQTPSQDHKEEVENSLSERLTPVLIGLLRTGENGLKEGLDKWREILMSDVRSAVKKHTDLLTQESGDLDAEVNDAGSQSQTDSKDKPLLAKTASLVQALTNLSHDDFLDLMRRIYASLLTSLHGAKSQSQIITGIVRASSPKGRLISLQSPNSDLRANPNDSLSATLETTLSSALFAATELAHSRVSKIIATRNEQHAKLKLREFYTFYEESWGFIVDCEVVCKRMVVGLRGTLGGQSKGFLQAFHADRLTRSAKMVEDELWAVIEVSPRSQRVANMIVDSAVKDAPEVIFEKAVNRPNGNVTAPISNSVSPEPQAEGTPLANGTQTNDASPKEGEGAAQSAANAKFIVIEDRSFYVVSATMQVLGLIVDYLKVMVNLPSMNMECMSRLVEFLKAFNSRTCQVVLGAGAMRSAGLKNITARHLALASQSLSIMIALIPYIRENFRRHLNPKQFVLLTEFDKLKRDYQEHQNEIHTKLINIMGERLAFHCKSLQDVQWDSPGGPAEGDANAYMQGLVRETVTLHKVLTKYLGPSATEPIMSEVFASINHRLGEEYQSISLPSTDAKDRLLVDARYLHEKLSALRGVGSLNNMLETIVQEKMVMRKSVLNPNGVPSSPGVGGNNSPGGITSGTPRPRGSIDLDGLQKSTAARQNSTGGASAVPINNLAARPSPFARRGFASLFGGPSGTAGAAGAAATSSTSNNASSSSLNQVSESGVITREGSPGPGASYSRMQIGSSSGVATPNTTEEARAASPSVSGPSPPHTPGTNAFSPRSSRQIDIASPNEGGNSSNQVEPPADDHQEGV
ncbi:hypothetical protein M408DRAFT_334212 [Serendipita vermifera MAFF 305830]|uniref:Vacuolar protein sorting-associated protein 54 C-terminal domain-containing protein n=1 Tax=Serendipita vermifera MAFF 305830 TaxID=933852 RepID=A0A0C3AIP4_SERVB|nr:hypothetical protein M408DRAFT_334212 [Serendipita vermifera MAFF 305830]